MTPVLWNRTTGLRYAKQWAICDITQKQELHTINELYQRLRLYINLLQPVMNVTEKIRVGSTVKKNYDDSTTPYQRVIASPWVPREPKEKLTEQYDKLNPVALNRNIVQLHNRLFTLQTNKRTRYGTEHRQTCCIDSYVKQQRPK